MLRLSKYFIFIFLFFFTVAYASADEISQSLGNSDQSFSACGHSTVSYAQTFIANADDLTKTTLYFNDYLSNNALILLEYSLVDSSNFVLFTSSVNVTPSANPFTVDLVFNQSLVDGDLYKIVFNSTDGSSCFIIPTTAIDLSPSTEIQNIFFSDSTKTTIAFTSQLHSNDMMIDIYKTSATAPVSDYDAVANQVSFGMMRMFYVSFGIILLLLLTFKFTNF